MGNVCIHVVLVTSKRTTKHALLVIHRVKSVMEVELQTAQNALYLIIFKLVESVAHARVDSIML